MLKHTVHKRDLRPGVGIFGVVFQGDSTFQTSPLATAFEQRLNANQNPNNQEVNSLLQGLLLLQRYKCKEAQAVLKRLADGGHLMHRLHQAQKDIECRARCIVTFLDQRPNAAKPQNVGNSEAGYNDLTNTLNASEADPAKHMVEILQAEGRLHLLFHVVDERKMYDPLVVQCLRAVAKDSLQAYSNGSGAAPCEVRKSGENSHPSKPFLPHLS